VEVTDGVFADDGKSLSASRGRLQVFQS